MRNQSGFTLIELVLVIIILGILAAVAVPRFINLSSEAQTAALQGTVGAINSASSINYAAYQVPGATGVTPIKGGTTTCTAAITGILQEPLDLKFTILGNPITITGSAGTVSNQCIIAVASDTTKQLPTTLLITN